MNVVQTHNRAVLCFVMFLVAIVLVSLACASTNNPFEVSERKAAKEANEAAATQAIETGATGSGELVVKTDTAESLAKKAEERQEALLESLYVEARGTVKIANWNDKSVLLANNLAGYIIVHGFNYRVELVEAEEVDYKTALPQGELDVVMQMSPDWSSGYVEAGTVNDVGSLFTEKPEIRIGIHPSLVEKAPELVEFLGNISPGDERFSKLANGITTGRVGMTPNVAALKYLRDYEDVWTRWVPVEVVEKVKAAIAAGKTNLENRMCVPGGGAGGGSPNCGT